MALNLKTLATRSTSAVFFVIILVSCIYYSYLSLFFLFFVVAAIALHEYYLLAEKLNVIPHKIIGYTFSALLFIYFSLNSMYCFMPFDLVVIKSILLSLLFLFPFILLILALFSNSASALLNAKHTLFGILYAVFPFALLVTIPVTVSNGALDYNYFKVLGIIFLIWSNDTFAYIGGSLFGKHKMYERISPGKTWEGTLIGVLITIAIGFLLNLNNTYAHNFVWPCIAIIVSVLGTIGDLVESMLKRMAGVKDSGKLMPGHGGALDRFDSLIFVSPFIYAFLSVLNTL
jgi:phosphatidate cytidylyltransferase